MTAISRYRGHGIYFDKAWHYVDDDTTVKEHHHLRPCGKCNRLATADDHDPCMANLPGVRNACCGHGDASEAYIEFDDMSIIRGAVALFIANNLTRSE